MTLTANTRMVAVALVCMLILGAITPGLVAADAEPTGIDVQVGDSTIGYGNSTSYSIILEYSNGQTEDITSEAEISVDPSGVLSINKTTGTLTSVGEGGESAVVTASYQGQFFDPTQVSIGTQSGYSSPSYSNVVYPTRTTANVSSGTLNLAIGYHHLETTTLSGNLTVTDLSRTIEYTCSNGDLTVTVEPVGHKWVGSGIDCSTPINLVDDEDGDGDYWGLDVNDPLLTYEGSENATWSVHGYKTYTQGDTESIDRVTAHYLMGANLTVSTSGWLNISYVQDRAGTYIYHPDTTYDMDVTFVGNTTEQNQTVTGTLDNFSDGDIAEYSGDTDIFGVVDGQLEVTGSSANHQEIYRNDVTVEQGTSFSADLIIPGDGEAYRGFLFGTQSDGSGYSVRWNPEVSEYQLTRDGTVLDSSLQYSHFGTTDVSVDWASNGDITVTIVTRGGDDHTLTANDNTYSSGGIGWEYKGLSGPGTGPIGDNVEGPVTKILPTKTEDPQLTYAGQTVQYTGTLSDGETVTVQAHNFTGLKELSTSSNNNSDFGWSYDGKLEDTSSQTKSDSATVTVEPAELVKVDLITDDILLANQTSQYDVEAHYENGTKIDVTDSATVTSSNSSIITVETPELVAQDVIWQHNLSGSLMVNATFNGQSDELEVYYAPSLIKLSENNTRKAMAIMGQLSFWWLLFGGLLSLLVVQLMERQLLTRSPEVAMISGLAISIGFMLIGLLAGIVGVGVVVGYTVATCGFTGWKIKRYTHAI